MKSAVKLFTLVFVLSLATAAFAGAGVSGKRSVTFNQPVVVAGQEVAAGTYELKYEGEAEDVKLTLTSNGKSLTTKAKLVALPKAASYNATRLKANGSAQEVREIEFAGKKDKLVFEDGKSVAKAD